MMFKDYIVLITGAASGIGYETARLFIGEGATVVGVDLDEAALTKAREVLGEHFVARPGDVSNEAHIAETARYVEERFGRLDTLVNNAGRGNIVQLEAMQESDFYWHYDVLVKGPMLMVKHFASLLRKSANPSILNISSSAARVEHTQNHFLYSTAKAAMLKFTQHIVRDLPGIRANTILPGWIDTPIYSRAGLDEATIKLVYEHALPRIPAGRIGNPEDIGHCILFLSSPKASYINGASIDIHGGYLSNADWGFLW
jgi:NAD(P)-dependent dehydrogenase (short-subunit alcohol dehydrogenase family)